MSIIDDKRAEAKRKFGYDVGLSGAMLLMALDDVGSRQELLMEEAIARIRQGHQPLQTDNPKAAFWFGIGRNLVWSLPLSLAVILTGWFYAQQDNYQDVRKVLETYPNAAEFRFLMQYGALKKSDDGMLNLILTPIPKDGGMLGKHYVYHEECKCVYVPMHF